jgi:uncharacterized LabA/DUF88 family protein
MQTFVFIDASNLFYGFDIEYGWKIDYDLLKKYLEKKYGAVCVFYFGGIDIKIGIQPNEEYFYDYSKNDTVDLIDYIKHLENILTKNKSLSESNINLIDKFRQRAKFYYKIESFGYKMFLKPVKYFKKDGYLQSKANCDVDLTIEAMRNVELFDVAIILSGDGDFLPLYKYLENNDKKVYVISRGSKTAREIRRHLGLRFIEIEKLRQQIELKIIK